MCEHTIFENVTQVREIFVKHRNASFICLMFTYTDCFREVISRMQTYETLKPVARNLTF